MTNYTVIPEFARQSILVSMHIRQYGARKEDKKVSKKVTAEHDAADGSGNFHKQLVPKESLEGITKAVTALRNFHYENTLPWLDEGERCLPAMNYEAYRTELEGLKDAFDTAVRDFCESWPQVVERAKGQLGALFNERDYPADVRDKFSCDVKFAPLPTEDDFRVALPEAELEKLRAAMRGQLDEAQRAAMGDIYRRLGDAVKAMAERLRAYTVDATTGKVQSPFRNSLVENLRDLVALVPRLNFAEDAELEAIRREVEGELCEADAGELRADPAVRESVAESAERIASRLGEFMA